NRAAVPHKISRRLPGNRSLSRSGYKNTRLRQVTLSIADVKGGDGTDRRRPAQRAGPDRRPSALYHRTALHRSKASLPRSACRSSMAVEVVPRTLEPERGVDPVCRPEIGLVGGRLVEEAVPRDAIAGTPRSDAKPDRLRVGFQLFQAR